MVEGIHNLSSVREQIKVKVKGDIGKASDVLYLHFQTASKNALFIARSTLRWKWAEGVGNSVKCVYLVFHQVLLYLGE